MCYCEIAVYLFCSHRRSEILQKEPNHLHPNLASSPSYHGDLSFQFIGMGVGTMQVAHNTYLCQKSRTDAYIEPKLQPRIRNGTTGNFPTSKCRSSRGNGHLHVSQSPAPVPAAMHHMKHSSTLDSYYHGPFTLRATAAEGSKPAVSFPHPNSSMHVMVALQ